MGVKNTLTGMIEDQPVSVFFTPTPLSRTSSNDPPHYGHPHRDPMLIFFNKKKSASVSPHLYTPFIYKRCITFYILYI